MLIWSCCGSGSSGNTAILSLDNRHIILDAGINPKDVLPVIDFKILEIQGVVLTHFHSDHRKYAPDYMSKGIKVYMPPTCKQNFKDRYAVQVNAMKPFAIDFATFTPFQVPHDGTECYGYYITAAGQRILWLTDLEYCPISFAKQKVNTIICECNYQTELVNTNEIKASHVFKGHMADTTCMEFLRVNKSEQLHHVILTHLSTENADSDAIKAMAREIVDCEVETAYKGIIVRLDDGLF